MEETIHVYFTSDLHSCFQNWPKITHGLREKITKHELNGDFYLIFDNGDHLDRSNPITDATFGKSNVTLLNEAKYNAVTLGNNEGITLPPDKLYHLYDEAQFKVVCANVKPMYEKYPKWLKPYHIFTTPSQLKIGVIGLTAPFQAFYEKIGWTTMNPIETLENYIPELINYCDIVIVLSHLGAYEEEVIANQFPIDAIIGGHTHHLYKQGQIINDTIIVAVGKHGHYYGEINLKVDRKNKKVISKNGQAIKVKEKEDQATVALLDGLSQKADKYLFETVTVLEERLENDSFKETPLMKRFVETLQQWTKADCAMLNAGVLLNGFDAGPVHKIDILKSCPHPMNPCTMILKGDQLVELVRMVEKSQFINSELKGLGFRGKHIGKMVYSNITIDYYEDTDYVETVYVNGQRVNEDQKYIVATADTFSFPQLVPLMANVKEKTYFLPEFIRDLLEVSLKNIEN